MSDGRDCRAKYCDRLIGRRSPVMRWWQRRTPSCWGPPLRSSPSRPGEDPGPPFFIGYGKRSFVGCRMSVGILCSAHPRRLDRRVSPRKGRGDTGLLVVSLTGSDVLPFALLCYASLCAAMRSLTVGATDPRRLFFRCREVSFRPLSSSAACGLSAVGFIFLFGAVFYAAFFADFFSCGRVRP